MNQNIDSYYYEFNREKRINNTKKENQKNKS